MLEHVRLHVDDAGYSARSTVAVLTRAIQTAGPNDPATAMTIPDAPSTLRNTITAATFMSAKGPKPWVGLRRAALLG